MRARTLVPLLGVLAGLLVPTSAGAVEIGLNVNGGAAAGAADFAQLTDSGAKWGRHFLFWQDAQAAAGDWAAYKTIAAENRARNVKTLLTVTGAGAAPDPVKYADYVGRLATALEGQVQAYEIYNEADGGHFWHGVTPQSYTDLLQRAYVAIKNADPNAKVVFSPTVGNHFEWLEQAYKAGAKGHFDVMAVHTDNACAIDSPMAYYRDEHDRIARFTFLGYRTVRETMLAHGDDKPIWMTEFGWSVAPGLCDRGTFAGQKNRGVSEAQQAQFLREAYHCMKEDEYLQVAMWFNSRDLINDSAELNNYGLKRFDGTDRPAAAAFRDITHGKDTVSGSCGDFSGPDLRVLAPKPNWLLAPGDPLLIKATSSDPGVTRISFGWSGRAKTLTNFSNKGLPINFSKGVPTLNWMGAKTIPMGAHTITVTAYDKSGNKTSVQLPGRKIRISSLPRTKASFAKVRLSGKGRVRKIRGRLKSTLPFRIPGKVVATWQLKSGKRWNTMHAPRRNANKPFSISQRLRSGGRWRVRLTYKGVRPFKKAASKWVVFKA